MFKIGNHLSSSKGYEAMGKMAVKLGAFKAFPGTGGILCHDKAPFLSPWTG